MDGNKRTMAIAVIAIAVGGAYFAVTQIMGDPAPTEAEAAQAAESGQEGGDASPSAEPDADAPAQHLDPEAREAMREEATITTEHFTATIDNLGGGVSRFLLTGDGRYSETETGEPIDVISTDQDGDDRHDEYQALRIDFGRIGIPEDVVWDITQVSETEVRLTWEGRGLRVVRRISAGRGPYQLWSTVRVTNLTNYARGTRLEMESWHWVERDDEESGFLSFASRSPNISQALCVYDDEAERKDRDKLVEEGPHGYGSGDVHVAAVENVYFTQAMAAHGEDAGRCSLRAVDLPNTDNAVGTLFTARLVYPWETLEPGAERTYRTLAYLGPKEPGPLYLAGHGLSEMVDLGFFALIARPLTRFLQLIHDFVVPNWGLAIILLTLLIRLSLFPVTNLSFKSMARMRQLKPEIDKINALYKDDPEKKGAAVMELYRRHKVNPLSGCLPMLLQMPVFYALYASLSTNIALFHMPFFGWWNDLSAPDPYFVLPLMLGGLMHVQQRLNPAVTDQAQAKMMMYFMPLMITVFMLFLPSGLCLYMLTNSVLGISQQKFNEYRLKQEPAAEAVDLDEDDDDDDASGPEGADDTSQRSQRRRPRRKRRVRRGRA